MMTTLLNNRYQTIQVLGAGGFGETFLAEDTYMPSRRRCVIKQLKPVANDPQMYQLIQQRFQREAATLESLGEGSDQIPNLYAYFFENEHFYLVQEWIQGQTLSNKVASVGPLSEAVVREILVSLLLVLDYVHSKGIIYRDIKPDNIIVRQSNGKPVLIDFGAVKETMITAVNSQGKITHSIVIGTPGFMSPEQATGRPIYASDLYSLGMTAIYLLTGLLPQELETDLQTEELLWQQHALNVSPSLAAVLNKAIQYHPRDRYTTAIKMLDALQSTTSNLPRQPSTQATLIVSPAAGKAFTQPTPVISPQKMAAVINHPSSLRNSQKSLILGSLLVASLIGAAAVVSVVQNQPPQSSIATSQPPRSTSEQQIATSTPTAVESPAPALEPTKAPPTPATAQSPSPLFDSAPQQKNEQLPDMASSPAASSVPQQKNENQNDSSNNVAKKSILGFPTGTPETRVKAALGKPTKTSVGYFPNTRALLYEVVPNEISLGYLIDRSSGRIRQTEVAFAQSVELQVMQATLQEMLGDRALVTISQGLQRVYQRRANNYSFNLGALKGQVERNERDRIYIAVWDADFH